MIEGSARANRSQRPDGNRGEKAAVRSLLFVVLVTTLFVNAVAASLRAQSSATQAPATSERLEFEVASVKRSNPGDVPHSNFPLGPGAPYIANPGLFSATGYPVVTYIAFAYKMQSNQFESFLSHLPSWLTQDRFSIQAKAEGSPTKDQMRLMMRSLLADRFKLVLHREAREVPALGLVLFKPGRTGPQLQAHRDDPSCSTTPGTPLPAALQPKVAGGFPATCGGTIEMAPIVRGNKRLGGRNVTVAQIANSFPPNELGRPLLEQTGLSGTFNFILEWTPEIKRPLGPVVDSQAGPTGSTFLEALREQLGLKLVPQKGTIDAIVVDHVEHPSED